MKRLVGFVAAVVVVLMASGAWAQNPSGAPFNFMNWMFFVNGCSTYTPSTPPPVKGYAMCIDTTSGAQYFWNGTAFVPSGSEMWSSNGGAGQTTATTTFFTAQGNSTNSTTEVATMELPLPFAAIAKNLNCYTSAAPGAGASDTFTVRTATSLGGTMGTTTLTCAISGATAKTCSDTTHSVTLAAGAVLDIQDVTASTPAARTIACAFEVDDQ